MIKRLRSMSVIETTPNGRAKDSALRTRIGKATGLVSTTPEHFPNPITIQTI